jgi:hypothetical protein
MLKFLTALLGVLNKLLGAWQAHHWKRQGRQEAAREAEDEIKEQIALGEAAVISPDPDRIERMRSKYDRSRSAQ